MLKIFTPLAPFHVQTAATIAVFGRHDPHLDITSRADSLVLFGDKGRDTIGRFLRKEATVAAHGTPLLALFHETAIPRKWGVVHDGFEVGQGKSQGQGVISLVMIGEGRHEWNR